MIDPHVHLRDWKQKSSETLYHGILTGVQCGINTFFDMPNTSPPIIDEFLALERLSDGKTACEQVYNATGLLPFYYIYFGLTSEVEQIRTAIDIYNKHSEEGIVGFKMFASHSTGDLGIINHDDQQRIYQILSEEGYDGVLAVHCEETSLFTDSKIHYKSRPAKSEVKAIENQINYALKTGFKGKLHICHVSTEEGIRLIDEARSNMSISCGVTPHHLLLNTQNEKGFVKMNPPLRSEDNRQAVFQALLDGKIDWIESDHAPHSIESKKKGACGIPGFEGLLRLFALLDEMGRRDIIIKNDERIKEVFGIEVPFVFPSFDKIDFASNSYCFSPWK